MGCPRSCCLAPNKDFVETEMHGPKMDGSIKSGWMVRLPDKIAVIKSEQPLWKCMRMVAELHAPIPHVSPFFRVKGRSPVPKPRHQKPENQKPVTGFHKKAIPGV